MTQAFTRQLGSEPGVQLNPLRDNSEIPATGQSDQVIGIIMRSTRGRIDKPFLVDRGNVMRRLGHGESTRVSALNEAWVHVIEALNSGAYQAVVQRLSTSAASIKWAVASADLLSFSISDDLPTGDFFLAVKHLECHNDGIKLAIHAEQKSTGGVDVANDKITLSIRDSKDELLFQFYGSLNPGGKDDYGQSSFLPDIVSRFTDAVIVEINANASVVQPDSSAYGYASSGKEKAASSDILLCFDEGGMAYETEDYAAARAKLQYSPNDYGYIVSGGTQNSALLAQLAQLAFDTNRQLKFDVYGGLDVDAAIAFLEQLNMQGSQTAHLMHAYYAPLKSDDPTGINGKGFFGTSALNAALCCGRNAQTNTQGFAPKNFPVAGREWPIRRTGIVQMFTPSDQDLNKLARAKINPVLFDTYSGGGRFVFRDSITCAGVENSLKKLIAVADMSCHIDDAVTRAGKDFLQLPMDLSVKRMTAYLESLFSGALAAGWLVSRGGSPYQYEVKPNQMRPYDRMDCSYWLSYDGTNRQTFVTQTLSRGT
ncbi:MAG: hypothetical protein ACR2HF_04755 [Methylococcaceae bacterium]